MLHAEHCAPNCQYRAVHSIPAYTETKKFDVDAIVTCIRSHVTPTREPETSKMRTVATLHSPLPTHSLCSFNLCASDRRKVDRTATVSGSSKPEKNSHTFQLLFVQCFLSHCLSDSYAAGTKLW